MRDKGLLRALVTLVLLVVVTCCALRGEVLAQEEPRSSDKRALFDFHNFKTIFHKSYQSISEEIWRNSIFLAHMMQSAASYYSYKHKKSSSFESINQMSDWTPGEFKQTLLRSEDYYRSMPEIEQSGAGEKSQSTKETVQDKTSGPRSNWLANWIGKAKSGWDKAYWESMSKLRCDKGKYRPDLPDEIYIDHRTRSNCLSEVQTQGKCGSCYIFSTLSLYEWAYCTKWGPRIKFSEQYLLDCGHLGGLRGCGGGDEFAVSEFVNKYGLEMHANYPYVSKQQTCPYEAKDEKKMGHMRMDGTTLGTVNPDKLEQELKVNPIIVIIRPSERLAGYGGGVDDGKGCGEDLSYIHSVLLVGSGRQDGHEYWIIRNSYGPTWGEAGYYRLRKDSKCLAWFTMGVNLFHKRNTPTGIVPEYKFFFNPKYDASILAAHFANH